MIGLASTKFAGHAIAFSKCRQHKSFSATSREKTVAMFALPASAEDMVGSTVSLSS
jgi:hypothetical protein